MCVNYALKYDILAVHVHVYMKPVSPNYVYLEDEGGSRMWKGVLRILRREGHARNPEQTS